MLQKLLKSCFIVLGSVILLTSITISAIAADSSTTPSQPQSSPIANPEQVTSNNATDPDRQEEFNDAQIRQIEKISKHQAIDIGWEVKTRAEDLFVYSIILNACFTVLASAIIAHIVQSQSKKKIKEHHRIFVRTLVDRGIIPAELQDDLSNIEFPDKIPTSPTKVHQIQDYL